MIGRSRFRDVVGRQLDLFERDHADLIRDVADAESAYNRAGREDAEDRYADYLDLVESAADVIREVRDNYASTLPESAAAEFEETFNRALLRRFPHVAAELDESQY